MHPSEGEMVCKAVLKDKVPYFNAPIFLENKTLLGKVDEIFGAFNEYVIILACLDGLPNSYYRCSLLKQRLVFKPPPLRLLIKSSFRLINCSPWKDFCQNRKLQEVFLFYAFCF